MTARWLIWKKHASRALQAAVCTAMALALLALPQRALAQCEGWHYGPFSTWVDGTDGPVYAFTEWDPDGDGPLGPTLVIGGSFTTIEGTTISNLAMRDPATGIWVAVDPANTAPVVLGLTVWQGKLVVGTVGDNDVGTFDQTVRTWDGSSWQSLATTNTGSVSTLAVYNNDLYIGGSFYTTHTIPSTAPASHIARWDVANQAWDNMNANTSDGVVDAMAVWNGELVVGGTFTIIGGNPHQGAARWNGSSWLSMGLSAGSVYAIQPFYGGLYFGGSLLDDGTTTMGGLGVWNGSTWSTAGGNFGGGVYSMTVYDGKLVIAGIFNGTSPNITQYDGASYSGLGAGIGTAVQALYAYGGVLYAGGSFTDAGGVSTQHLALWNGSGWSRLGGGTVGGVLAMTSFMGQLVAGGSFSQSTFSVQPAVNITAWNGVSLSPFGSGMDGQVNALKSFKYSGILGKYELIAGGYFTHAGGIAANRIARWDVDPYNAFPPPAWEAMGPGMDGPVLAIERYNNNTYAGGNFYYSGATALANIGRWNSSTSQWDNIVGSNGPVYALKAYNGYLYAGGAFTAIGGVTTGGFARYDGSSWSNCGGYFNGVVNALEIYNGVLVVGGDYPGINSSPDLAWYNGSGYGTYGTGGSNNVVTALHVNGSRLYVGGTFTTLGGIPADHIGYWDGSWHGATGGADNSVYALGEISGEEQVGGAFLTVSNSGVVSPGWARYSDTGLPWFGQQPYDQSVTSGTDVTMTARTVIGYSIQSRQWLYKGTPIADGPTGHGSTISGALGETIVIQNVTTADAGLYRLLVTTSCGDVSSNEVTLTVDGVTATPHEAPIVADAIERFGPNPTGGRLGLTFALTKSEPVQMRIFDVSGRLVRSVDAGSMAAGRHDLVWDGRDAAGQPVRTGLYFVMLEADGRSLGSRRVVMQR